MDVGFMELVMLAALALLIFGPERLPGIARSVGRVVGQVRREASSTFDALRAEVELDELQALSDDLKRERDELRSRARIDARSLHAQATREARHPTADYDADGEPRYDPHAT